MIFIMARIEIVKKREQTAHFGLYRTSAGGDQEIFVRRKVGEPTDYMHTKSRKVARQRENLALASQHYAHLTPSQKAITRHQIEEVEYQKPHGKTDTKILLGRQLFIAKELRSLEATGKQLAIPYELCIMLVDENLSPLTGELWLYCTVSGEWFDLPKDEIWTGNWLFSKVPPGYAPYRVYGEADGYFDPLLPEHQAMSEDYLLAYHYHKLLLTQESETLYPNGDGSITDLITSLPDAPHWWMVLNEDTEWHAPPPGWGYWTGNYVLKNWYPWGERADLYTFTNPQYAAQHIYHLIAHCLVGRDTYPYGKCRVILKTHGQLYYSDYEYPNQPYYCFERDFTENPYTNKEWTREEVQSLQLGIAMDKVGSFGNMICDKISIELRYL